MVVRTLCAVGVFVPGLALGGDGYCAPTAIEVDATGNAVVLLDDRQRFASLEELREGIPAEIPVREFRDGEWQPGVVMSAHDGRFHEEPYTLFPAKVVLEPDGSWSIDWMRISAMQSKLRDGESIVIPGSEGARVVRAFDDASGRQESLHGNPGRASLSYSYSHSGAPSAFTEAEIRSAIDIAFEGWSNLLVNDGVSANFVIRWVPGLQGARALVSIDDRRWNQLRGAVQALYGGTDLDPDEGTIYNNFPLGNNISYSRSGNANDQTDDILLSDLQLGNLFGSTSGNPLVIEIGTEAMLTLDPFLDPVGSDFVAVVAHEVGHHMGFLSNVEALEFIFEDEITFWDVYRFRRTSPVDVITANEMFSGRRELDQRFEAIAGTALNALDKTYDLARGDVPFGDDAQASHWKEGGIADYIGVMTPFTVTRFNDLRALFYPSDIAAFDLIGWNIDQDTAAPPPPPSIPTNQLTPSGGLTGVDSQSDLVLSWAAATDATSYSVQVFEDTETSVEVFLEVDIVGLSATVPAGTLNPGSDFSWQVVARNWNTFVPSGVATFSTTGIPCSIADIAEPFGIVDLGDIDTFIPAFQAGDPIADIAEPFGIVDLGDIDTFIPVFLAGCP